MAARAQSRKVGTKENLFGFLTEKKVTYHRDVKKERAQRIAKAKADASAKAHEEKQEREWQRELQADYAYEMGAKDKRAGRKQLTPSQVTLESAKKALGVQKATALARSNYVAGYRNNPKKNPAVSGEQYRLAQAVLSGTARSSMPRKVAREIVDRTPAAKRSEFMKANPKKKRHQKGPSGPKVDWRDIYKEPDYTGPGRRVGPKANPAGYPYSVQTAAGREYFKDIRSANAMAQSEADRTGKTIARKDASGGSSLFHTRKAKGNPAKDAQALSRKFHGRKATTTERVVEELHVHKHLMKIGPLVRLVIDTPTGLVAVLNFDTRNPRKIVELATSERDPKTGKLVGKQLYLRGGDQEINLASLKMDTPLWIRDKMELGRLHEFKRGDRLIIDAAGKMRHAQPGERAKADENEIRGSITYQSRKGMDDFKLINYWHRAGEETSRKYGPAARALVVYDYPNKKIEFVGGQYVVDSPGIIN